MQKDQIVKSFDGTELYCRRDLAKTPKGAVVIVHGLGEHCRRYDWIVKKLNAAGWSVWRFDNRGHGRSGGARGWLDGYEKYFLDADAVVERALWRNPGKPVFMLGHSMGGFIAAGYGVRYPGKLKGQVFSGSCASAVPIFEDLREIDIARHAFDQSENALSHLISRSERVVDAYRNDPYVLQVFAKKLLHEVFIVGIDWLMSVEREHGYPCLILHGGDDRIVPVECSRFLYEHSASRDKTLKVYPNLYHEILNEEKERSEVVKDLAAWLDERA